MKEKFFYADVFCSSVPLPADIYEQWSETTSDYPLYMFQRLKNDRNDLRCHYCHKKLAKNKRCVFLGMDKDGEWIFSHVKCFERKRRLDKSV